MNWFIPESPRWLLSRGRKEEAMKILLRAAEVNGAQLPDKVFEHSSEEQTSTAKITEMFMSPVLLARTLIIFFQWMVVSCVFYGLALNVGNLGGNIYINFTIGNIVDVFTYLLCLALLDRTGRRLMHSGSMFLAGVACICTVFPALYAGPGLEWIIITLSMVGRFGASSVFAVIYVFTPELFPTVVRNSGMGSSSFSARIGGIVSPYIADLGSVVGGRLGVSLPQIVFGSFALMAGVLSLWLPETLNRKLPETIEDAKYFGRRTSGDRLAMEIQIEETNTFGRVNRAFREERE